MPRARIPIVTKCLIVIVAVVPFEGCAAGPYHDLEVAFRTRAASTAPKIEAARVVLGSTKREGASSYGPSVLAVGLPSGAVEIRPTFPASLGMDNLRIPSEAISGCAKTCYGTSSWTADLLIQRADTEISFERSPDVIEWCWKNRIPVISSTDHRNWLYRHSPLPERSQLIPQLASREQFERQINMSCAGE